MKILPCECGSCPVLERTESGAYRAGCANPDCRYFSLFTLADKDKIFVLNQWNTLTDSRNEDEEKEKKSSRYFKYD
jgi:hypothetical protein